METNEFCLGFDYDEVAGEINSINSMRERRAETATLRTAEKLKRQLNLEDTNRNGAKIFFRLLATRILAIVLYLFTALHLSRYIGPVLNDFYLQRTINAITHIAKVARITTEEMDEKLEELGIVGEPIYQLFPPQVVCEVPFIGDAIGSINHQKMLCINNANYTNDWAFYIFW